MAKVRPATVLIVAALALLVILVAYAVSTDPDWAQLGYWRANFIETPWAIYARSDGTFDEPARLALARARDRPAPTAFDHALSGIIIARNILQREHRPAVDARGAPTREALELAQHRRAMLGEARNHFMEAVHRLGAAGADGHAAGRAGAAAPRAEPRAEPLRATNAGFVIDAATDFAFGGAEDALAHDPLMAVLVAGDWGVPPERLGPAGLLGLFGPAALVDRPLATAATQRRTELVADRQAAARQIAQAEGGALGAATETYAALATQHTDDHQNAHDSSVLACLRATVQRLRADQAGLALPTTREISDAIADKGAQLSSDRPHRVADALGAVAAISHGERVVAVDATDTECLARVWLRSSDPRNVEVRNRLQQAIFDALVDCWEDGLRGRHLVCVTGRTTRVLSSLVLLDWDERNWVVTRFEQFKNDILEQAQAVVRAKAEAASLAADPDTQRAGRLYLATSLSDARAVGDVPAAATAALAGEMRAAILAMVDDYRRRLESDGLQGAIPDHMIEAVKMEAAAIVL